MAPAPQSLSRLRERRHKRRMMMLYIVLFLVIAVCGGIIGLLHVQAIRVSTITIQGAETVSSTTLQTFAAGEITGSYFHLVPKNNILFYPKEKMQKDILAAFPALQTTVIHASSFSSISISVSEHQPMALWCSGQSTVDPGTCLLLDADGLAYATAPVFSSPVYVSYFGVLPSSAKAPIQFLKPADFNALSALVAALTDKANIGAVSAVSIDGNYDVRMQFANGFMLIFALRDDTGKVLSDFVLALTTAPFTSHPLSSFQYLDLRFGD